MGTNFYALKKITPQIKQELHQKLDRLLSGTIEKYQFQDLLEEKILEIHLGKRSGGWQFLWQYQPEYYQDNLTSIMEFLLSGDYIIKDEYGQVFEFNDFLETEIGDSLYSGYTHESYMKDHPEERPIPDHYRDWITKDGLRFVKDDFS